MVKQFKDQSFKYRFAFMGDLAQGVFKSWATRNGVKVDEFGFDRPPFSRFPQLSPFMRYSPDFVCESEGKAFSHVLGKDRKPATHILVETKGVGKDQLLKIKFDNYEELKRWQTVSETPVVIFVYNSFEQLVSTSLTLDRLGQLISVVPTGEYVEGDGKRKPYYAIHIDHLEWQKLPNDEEMFRNLSEQYKDIIQNSTELVELIGNSEDPNRIWDVASSLKSKLSTIEGS